MQFAAADLEDEELSETLKLLMNSKGVMWTMRGEPGVVTFYWKDARDDDAEGDGT